MAIRGREPGTSGVSRQLRTRATPAEVALWRILRDRQLSGLKFRRQHAIGPFVTDFCCASIKLIVELDGAIHDQQMEQDQTRTEYLEQLGYRVVRFRNEEVMWTSQKCARACCNWRPSNGSVRMLACRCSKLICLSKEGLILSNPLSLIGRGVARECATG